MNKLKTLYELARAKLFEKSYYCEYCGMEDFDKYFMIDHINTYHDIGGKAITMFNCIKCHLSMSEMELLVHHAIKTNERGHIFL